METTITAIVVVAVIVYFMQAHIRGLRHREKLAQESLEKGEGFSEGPKGQHPFIHRDLCIGCASCTTVCPEGDVLAMLGGQATIVNGQRCIGHGICAEVCPVGGIELVMAAPGAGHERPYLTPEFETNIPNLFIVGELGGLALIKNAISQGRDCIDIIASRMASRGPVRSSGSVYDVLIIGAGPAGISASLRAIENRLHYLTIEQDEVGGTVAKYPRQKIVMTSPMEFPMYGKFSKTELSKEHLLAFWDMVLNRADFNVWTGSKVENVQKDQDGIFTVSTPTNQYRAHAVVLAIGRSGNPRKLGVKGEELPKVMYRLIEADHYTNNKIMIVGGGDSAVEAAMGLAVQPGNRVIISYRKGSFNRIKARNLQRIEDNLRNGNIEVAFNSNPLEFKPGSVVLETKGGPSEIPNDFVWIFAGGEPPNAFLKKIGVSYGES